MASAVCVFGFIGRVLPALSKWSVEAGEEGHNQHSAAVPTRGARFSCRSVLGVSGPRRGVARGEGQTYRCQILSIFRLVSETRGKLKAINL